MEYVVDQIVDEDILEWTRGLLEVKKVCFVSGMISIVFESRNGLDLAYENALAFVEQDETDVETFFATNTLKIKRVQDV